MEYIVSAVIVYVMSGLILKIIAKWLDKDE